MPLLGVGLVRIVRAWYVSLLKVFNNCMLNIALITIYYQLIKEHDI